MGPLGWLHCVHAPWLTSRIGLRRLKPRSFFSNECVWVCLNTWSAFSAQQKRMEQTKQQVHTSKPCCMHTRRVQIPKNAGLQHAPLKPLSFSTGHLLCFQVAIRQHECNWGAGTRCARMDRAVCFVGAITPISGQTGHLLIPLVWSSRASVIMQCLWMNQSSSHSFPNNFYQGWVILDYLFTSLFQCRRTGRTPGLRSGYPLRICRRLSVQS